MTAQQHSIGISTNQSTYKRINNMNINDIKKIKLADYLQSLGYTPVKQQGKSLWYKSPLRNETDASFKVNTELNQWYDFGIGKGGATSSHWQRNYTIAKM